MRPLRVLLVLWSLLLSIALPSPAPQEAEATPETLVAPPAFVPRQLLVGFLPGVAEVERDTVVAARGGRTVAYLATLDARLIAVSGARPLGEVARAFVASGAVRYAEPNAVARVATTPSDPRIGEQWALRTVGALDSAGNWALPPGDRRVVVGIVDSGINADHPDLAANLWAAPAEWALGCPAGSHGYSVIGGEPGCVPSDQFGSGTALAGVVGAAGDNAIGISGINQRAGLMALKCVDAQGVVRIADAVAVIEHAIAAKSAGVDLRVLVIGWTTRIFSQPLHDVIAAAGAAGILVVATAGDTGKDIDTEPHYPASFAAAPYNLPNVISVLGTDQYDGRGVSMNHGANSVHLAAPGSGVLTTAASAQEYAERTGSALAAAHVAGAAALTIAATPDRAISIAALRSRLLACGDPVLELTSSTTTGRRLNVARTIANDDCEFTLTTEVETSSARGSIQVEPSAPTYRSNTVVTLTAHPAAGYRFDSWEIDGVAGGNATRRSLTIDADRRVVARFVRATHQLTLTASSGGSIVASPQPVGGVYESGTMVQLTASPLPGFQFSGWLLDTQPAGADPILTVVMDRDRAVRANFVSTASPAPSPGVAYPLTLAATAGGAVVAVPGAGPYPPGARVSLSATPLQGYVFTGWTIDGLAAGRANPYTITISAPRTVVANFAPAQVLNLSYTSGGRVDPSAATWEDGSPYPLGTVVTLTATTASNGVFTGWTIDGAFAGWTNPLTLTMDRPHTVVATFAARPRFGDLPPGPPPYEAIAQLAARGIVRGYQNGDFGANDTTLRAQMAGLIVRAMGWEEANLPNPFSDRGEVDDGLWRSVATLAAYDVARGYGDGTFGATDPVLQIQTVSFITRAMIRAGYWQVQPDNPALFAQIPPESGHREDLSTYVHYVGAPPGADPSGNWATWDTSSSRGWFAQALWQALDGHFSVDRVP